MIKLTQRLNPLHAVRASARRAKGVVGVLGLDVEAEMSPFGWLAGQAARRGDHPCLLFEARRWTFAEAVREVERRAAVLAARGIGQGDTVALMQGNRPGFIFNLLAMNRLGAVPALINPTLKAHSLLHAIRIVEPVAEVIAAERLAQYREALADEPDAQMPRLSLIDLEPGGQEVTEDWPEGAVDLVAEANGVVGRPPLPEVTVRGTDLLAYVYTSGTTGLPKAGKVINGRGTMVAVGFGQTVLALGPEDVIYCCLPLFHSSGFLIGFCCALYNGATLALARRFSATHFWDDVRRTKATCFVYIGEICRYLLAQPPSPLDGQHQVTRIIGNGMRPEVWEPFVERFKPGRVHEFYGATEGNVNMINPTGRTGSVGLMPPLWLNNGLLVRFDPVTEKPLRDASGRCIPCKRGEIGELIGRIDDSRITQRFDGYADEEATQKKILRDVLEPGDAYFRSGDLMRRDWLGYYYFVDRIGDTFRWKGENVSTTEVASVVQGDDSIEIANVYGVKVPGAGGRAGMVALVMKEGRSFDPDAFYRHVTRELPDYAAPAFVRVVSAMDLTATFKLRKVELVEEGFDPREVDDPIYYRDDRASRYRPLDSDAFEGILSGRLRL